MVACALLERYSRRPAPQLQLIVPPVLCCCCKNNAGGVSTWTKSSSGGPPAPGATSDGEGGVGGVAGLEGLGSTEDQALAGPRYTLRWALGVGATRGTLGGGDGVSLRSGGWAGWRGCCVFGWHACSVAGRIHCAPCQPRLACAARACSDDHPESPPIGKSKFLAREADDITPAASSGVHDLQSVSLDSPRK